MMQAITGTPHDPTHCADDDSEATLFTHTTLISIFQSEDCIKLLTSCEEWLRTQAEELRKILQSNICIMCSTQNLWSSGILSTEGRSAVGQKVKSRDPADIVWLKSQEKAVTWFLDDCGTGTSAAKYYRAILSLVCWCGSSEHSLFWETKYCLDVCAVSAC